MDHLNACAFKQVRGKQGSEITFVIICEYR